MGIHVLRKTLTLTCKMLIKVTISVQTWNDPTVIRDILPQAVSFKLITKVQFLRKVLKSSFPKVWDSFPGQYSIIWRSFCSKFNDNPIRTRLKRSREPRKSRFSTESWIYIRLLLFWSSAAEAAACKYAGICQPMRAYAS